MLEVILLTVTDALVKVASPRTYLRVDGGSEYLCETTDAVPLVDRETKGAKPGITAKVELSAESLSWTEPE